MKNLKTKTILIALLFGGMLFSTAQETPGTAGKTKGKVTVPVSKIHAIKEGDVEPAGLTKDEEEIKKKVNVSEDARTPKKTHPPLVKKKDTSMKN